MKRLLFIYNPCAGKGKIAAHLSEIISVLSKTKQELIVHATTGRNDARELAKKYAGEGLCDRIICAGGDGTMNEVTSGVCDAGADIPVGLIPAGSTNDFGYTLGLPETMPAAAVFAATHEAYSSDIGCLDGKYFTYTAAFGSFADVSYDTLQQFKNAVGHLAYILKGVTKLSQLKSVHARIEYDEGVIEDNFIHGMIVSSNSVGGFRGLPGEGVKLDDGLHEMILVRDPKNAVGLAKAVNELLHHRFDEAEYVRYAKVSRMTVYTKEPLAWSIDGEFGGETTEAKIEVKKKAVRYVRQSEKE